MSSREERETLAALFLLPDTIAVEAVYPTKSRLTLQISCTLQSASCPLCQQLSERIHGKYGRTVADVPCGGRRVTLALTVRKFVCGTPDCPRKIFTERLSDLVQSYARMTNRLALALQILGFATCGQLGERFAPKLGMQVSGPTLLRRMRTCSYAPPASVAVVGIDDWAWKKGRPMGRSSWIYNRTSPSTYFQIAQPKPQKPGFVCTLKWTSSAVIEGAIMQQQPRKALLKRSRLPIDSTCSKISARGSRISWIGDTPVYPKWKKQELMRFLQKHKGSTLPQQTGSQNHEQSQQ